VQPRYERQLTSERGRARKKSTSWGVVGVVAILVEAIYRLGVRSTALLHSH
jgi:hypothetical protein